MTTQHDDPERTLAGAVSAVGDHDLRALVREELERLDPAARALVARRLREHADYRLSEGKRRLEAAPGRLTGEPEPVPPARLALGLTLAALFLIGFVGFWYGMAVGVPHHGGPPSRPSPAWALARAAWGVLLAVMLVRDARRGELAGTWAMARRVTLPVVGLNVLVIAATVAVAVGLDRLFPWLDRSWLYLLPGIGDHATNIGLIPMQVKYFGIAFLLLLAARVPGLARGEEMKYRRGTVGWRDGAARSVRFGLAHCIVGVPLYAGLALTVGGLWFTHQYLRGGVERSTLHHATYNWLVLAVCLVVTLISTFR